MPIGYFGYAYYLSAIVPPSSDGDSDLMAAVVARLRSTPEVVLALGENTSSLSTTKIWADDMAFQCGLPWLTYGEMNERIQGTTGRTYVATGMFQLSIVHRSKSLARTLGTLVKASLDNAPLLIDGGYVRRLRHDDARFETIHGIAPGTPATYKMVIDFDYMLNLNFNE